MHEAIKRLAHEAETEDILELFEKLNTPDNAGIRPRFMTDDVFHIPRIAPEDGGSLMSVVDTMAQMRKEITQLQENVSKMRLEVSSQGEVIHKVKSDVERSSYAHKVAGATRPQDTFPPVVSRIAANQPSSSVVTNKMVSQALQAVADESNDNQTMSSDGFVLVENKRRKTNDNRQRRTAGTATNAGRIMAGPESLHVQLTNVHRSVDIDTIRDYVKNQDKDIEIKEIKDTSTEGWETRRYLVTFNMDDQEKVLKGEFWPEKIYFKRWYVNRPAKDKAAGKFTMQ